MRKCAHTKSITNKAVWRRPDSAVCLPAVLSPNTFTHQEGVNVLGCRRAPFYPAVYDLLDSPDCLPDLLQGSLKSKGRDEAFLLSSFRLQSRAPTSLYSVVNPKDGSKYLELSVQAKLSKGVCDGPATCAFHLPFLTLTFFRCQWRSVTRKPTVDLPPPALITPPWQTAETITWCSTPAAFSAAHLASTPT